MARSNSPQPTRRPEDWFPPARSAGIPTSPEVDAAIAAAIAALVIPTLPITESDVTNLTTDLAAKLDDSQAGAFGLTLLGAVNLAAAKISLAYSKADIGLGNVDNTSDVNKPVSTAQQTALDLKLDDSQAGAFGLTLLGSADLAAARAALGGYQTVDVDFTDAGNSGTSETVLFTYTIPASGLGVNGDRYEVQWSGVFVSSGTATRQLKAYLAGNNIFDTGALTISLAASWEIECMIMRVSATVVRYSISMTTQGAALAAYTAVGEVTGLTLSNTNIVELKGTAGGIGAATNDIVGKLAYVEKHPVT